MAVVKEVVNQEPKELDFKVKSSTKVDRGQKSESIINQKEKKTQTNTILVEEVKEIVKELGGTTSDTYTKAQIDALFQRISNLVALSDQATENQYPNAKNVWEWIKTLKEAIDGKKGTYVVSSVENPQFDSSDPYIDTEDFVDINGNTIHFADLKVGENIYVLDLDVPDRWIAGVYESSALCYALETSKASLTDYLLKTEAAQTYKAKETNISTVFDGTPTTYDSSTIYSCVGNATALNILDLETKSNDTNPFWRFDFHTSSSGFTLTSTPTLKWANGFPPEFEGDSDYIILITKSRGEFVAVVLEF